MAKVPQWLSASSVPSDNAPADALVSSTVPPGSLAALLAVFLKTSRWPAGRWRARTSTHKGNVAEL
jgi:hypothetical protein